MKTYYYNFAGSWFQLNVDFPISESGNYLPFRSAACCKDREIIDVSMVSSFPVAVSDVVWKENTGTAVVETHPVILHRVTPNSAPYSMELVLSDNHRQLLYLQDTNEQPKNISQVFENLGLEELMLRHDTLLLHSSLIRWNQSAVLFSAPSGTGKSTQAALWEQYRNAEILNGDRAGLCKKHGKWNAYGLPYAGTSGIYRNENAPIRCIVMLEQGPENKISPLTPGQAFRRMYPEVMLHRWDEAFLTKGMDLLTDLLTAVPVYLLSCRPDQEAVELLHNTITRED